MRADLHMHSVFSDGNDTPEKIIEIAKNNGVQVLSITDHDTLKGLKEKKDYALKAGLKYINGIEFSGYDEMQVHILGYAFDENSQILINYMNSLIANRHYRIEKMLFNLKKIFGIDIKYSELVSTGGDEMGSMHIAKALCQRGYANGVKDAFNKYIGKNAKGYVKDKRVVVSEAINVINAAGGVCSLAHPIQLELNFEEQKEYIKRLVSYGLKGIEAYYSTHTVSDTRYYEKLAEEYGLFVTGGSDYHGEFRPERIGTPEFFLSEKAEKALKI